MSRIIRPKNWGEFQHYKDRSPAWIKLHKRLLDDFEFQCLPLASRALAPMLWLLASEHAEGHIDADPRKLSFRLRATEEELVPALEALLSAGFFEIVPDGKRGASTPLAKPERDASPEKRTSNKEQGREETEKKSPERASPSSARAPAERVCEALGIGLSNPSWPGEISVWLGKGGNLDDLLAAAKRERERGNASKPLRWFLTCSEDFKTERLAKQTQEAQACHYERMLWLDRYAMDGKWMDVLGIGPAPHEPGTLVTAEELDRVKGARAMRDNLAAERNKAA